MRFLSLILSLAFFSCFSKSQSDSLMNRLQIEESDSLRVEILFQLAQSIDVGFQSSVRHASDALGLARETGLTQLEAKVLRFLGTIHWSHSNYEASRKYLLEAIRIFDLLGDDLNKGECLNTLGLTYYYQADFPEALSHLTKALEFFFILKDSSQIARVSNNIGLIYNSNGKFDSANSYFIQGLNHKLSYRSIRDQSQSAKRQGRIYKSKSIAEGFTPQLKTEMQSAMIEADLNKVASVYSKVGGIHLIHSRFDSALLYFQKASVLYDSLQNRSSYGLELLDIAKCYSKLGMEGDANRYYELTLPLLLEEELNPTIGAWHIFFGNHLLKYQHHREAIIIFEKGLAHASKLGHLASASQFHSFIAGVYMQLKSYEKAIESAQQALRIAEDISSFKHKRIAIEALYQGHRAFGNLQDAVRYQGEYYEMTLQFENAKTERASQEFEATFRFQEQVKEISTLTQDNELKDLRLSRQLTIIYYSSILVLLSIVFYVLLKRRLRRVRLLNQQIADQNSSLESKNQENELLMKEIHHRVKNNLQIVSNMISLQKRRVLDLDTKSVLEHTQSRIGVIGLIHEHLYKMDDISAVSMQDYIPHLTSKLLESFYEGPEVDVKYDIQVDKLDLDTSILVGIITHEIVVNSIKYAFEDNEAPVLGIEMQKKANKLELNFRDNGPGISKTGDGFGWTIIQSIVENADGQLSHKNEGGLQVSVTLGM